MNSGVAEDSPDKLAADKIPATETTEVVYNSGMSTSATPVVPPDHKRVNKNTITVLRTLSSREFLIYLLFTRGAHSVFESGATVAGVAERLRCRPETVERHLRNLRTKLLQAGEEDWMIGGTPAP